MSELKPRCNNPDNVNAAAEMFLNHGDLILSVIKCQVKDEHLRKDIYQDFFVKLASKPLPEEVENIRAYLYRTVCNHIADILRQQETYRRNLYQHNERSIRRFEYTEDNKLEQASTLKGIYELIESNISGYLAKVVKLRHQEDLSNDEIAKRLNVGKSSVKVYYSLALKKLREKVKNMEVKP